MGKPKRDTRVISGYMWWTVFGDSLPYCSFDLKSGSLSHVVLKRILDRMVNKQSKKSLPRPVKPKKPLKGPDLYLTVEEQIIMDEVWAELAREHSQKKRIRPNVKS